MIARALWRFIGTPTGCLALLFLGFAVTYGVKNGT